MLFDSKVKSFKVINTPRFEENFFFNKRGFFSINVWETVERYNSRLETEHFRAFLEREKMKIEILWNDTVSKR